MYTQKEDIILNIEELKPHQNNPKKHQEEIISKSIKDLGFFGKVIIDENNTIIAGHGRVKSLKKQGVKKVECQRIIGWTEEEKQKALLIDNQSTILGGFDDDLLKLFDKDILDYSGFESLEENEAKEDNFEIPDEIKTDIKVGDLFEIKKDGKTLHRLLCGDATKKEDVERLMNGEKADMVFTDPPYALFGNSKGMEGLADDEMIKPFFREVGKKIKEFTAKRGHIYSCCDWKSFNAVSKSFTEESLTTKNIIIWDKESAGMGGAYMGQYEMIIFSINNYFIEGKTTQRNSSDRKITDSNLWREKRVLNRKHNAQKPIKIIERAVENSSDENQLILDLFGGSGSTMIACHQLNRRNFMMELEPKYCQVILDRIKALDNTLEITKL